MSDDLAPPGVPAWFAAHMKADDLALARLEERLAGIAKNLDEMLARHETRLGAHSEKIRSLELRLAGLAGGGGVALILIGYLMWAANFVWGK